MKRIAAHWPKISTGLLLALLLGTGAVAARNYFSDGNCCAQGAECCKPGASCCLRNKHAVKH